MYGRRVEEYMFANVCFLSYTEEGYSSVDPMTAMAILEKVCYGKEVEEVHDAAGEGSGTADVSNKP